MRKRKRTIFARSPEPQISLRRSVTLEGMKRSMDTRAKWVDQQVLIFSREHNAFWRPNGAGYTVYVDAAGLYDSLDAYKRTMHCDKDKGIMFYAAPKNTLRIPELPA